MPRPSKETEFLIGSNTSLLMKHRNLHETPAESHPGCSASNTFNNSDSMDIVSLEPTGYLRVSLPAPNPSMFYKTKWRGVIRRLTTLVGHSRRALLLESNMSDEMQ